jgi:electron transfer flavoprotein alpha subunit
MANGILILAERQRDDLADITFELLGAGRALADTLKVPMRVALLGGEAEPLASRLGLADEVLLVPHPQLSVPAPETVAAALKALMEERPADLVLLGVTNASLGVGSFLSLRTGLPYISYCRGIRVEDGALVLTSQLFGGKIFSDVRFPDGRGVAGVYSGSYPADAGRSDRTPTVTKLDLQVTAPAVTFERFIEPPAGDVDITKQAILVSVGRGIQTRDNIEMAEQLAQALGGAVSGSRPVIDQGWLPLTRQVGKSGVSVKPRLYLALGISGAPEHQEGMKDAPLIVAVNTDPSAPIFDVAHYGTTTDLFDLFGPLMAAIEQRKAAR